MRIDMTELETYEDVFKRLGAISWHTNPRLVITDKPGVFCCSFMLCLGDYYLFSFVLINDESGSRYVDVTEQRYDAFNVEMAWVLRGIDVAKSIEKELGDQMPEVTRLKDHLNAMRLSLN